VSARTVRRVEALEAKTPTGDDSRPLKLIADRGEPDVPARIAALHEAGFSVIRLIGVSASARASIRNPFVY